MNTKSRRGDGPGDSARSIAPENPAYRRRTPIPEAECIYFFLVPANHKEQNKVYFVDRERTIFPYQMPDEIVDIMSEIDAGRLQEERRPIECRRKSYFACVLNDRHSRLQKDNAVVFKPTNGRSDQSYRNGRDIESLPGPYSDLSAFFCTNHMKHSEGHVIKDNECEGFNIYFNHVHRALDDTTTILDHEDSSTNLGPPRPPPP